MKVYEIPTMSRQSKGRNIINLLQLKKDEKVTSIINVHEFDEERQLVMATQNGLVKKTVLSAYGNPRSNGVIALKLDDDDTLIGVALTSGGDEIMLGTRDGMAIRFNEKQARSLGRVSRGVIGIKMRKGDAVVDMVIVEEGASLLTVCEKGYGKRTALEEYRLQSRSGLGIINIKATSRNGKVVALKAVCEGDELMMITAGGMIIRTGLDEMRIIGRNTAGVRMINLKSGDTLVAVERLAKDQEEDAGEQGEEAGGQENTGQQPPATEG
jgi:DNA gyrase subunit A